MLLMFPEVGRQQHFSRIQTQCFPPESIYMGEHTSHGFMRRIFFVLLAFSWMLASCEFFPTDPKLTTSVEDHLYFEAEGGDASIMVSSNCDWEAEGIATIGVFFLSVSPSNGRSGDSVLKIHARENLRYGRRTAAVKLKYRNPYSSTSEPRELLVPVYQDGAPAKIWFDNWQEPTLPAEGGSFTADLLDNGCPWNIFWDEENVKLDIKSESWNMADPYSKCIITFTVSANPSSENRTFVVNLTDRKPEEYQVYGQYTFHQAGSK